jgi:hypothetical protein
MLLEQVFVQPDSFRISTRADFSFVAHFRDQDRDCACTYFSTYICGCQAFALEAAPAGESRESGKSIGLYEKTIASQKP